MSARIVFFGNEQLTQGLKKVITPIFDSLVETDHEILALVLPREPDSRSRNKAELTILKKAKENNIQVIFADQEEDLNTTLKKLNADIGILASFGKIVKKSTIDLFPKGIINLHPSLLPKYRGTTPIESAILNGDKETGVSLMELSAKMDAGPVYEQVKISLNGNESKQELYETLGKLGAEMIIKNLPEILSGELEPKAQDENQATYTEILTKDQSKINPKDHTADELVRQVRAFQGFPKAKISIGGTNAIILVAHASDTPEKPEEACFKASDGRYLIVDEIIPENGKPMSVEAYLNGKKNLKEKL